MIKYPIFSFKKKIENKRNLYFEGHSKDFSCFSLPTGCNNPPLRVRRQSTCKFSIVPERDAREGDIRSNVADIFFSFKILNFFLELQTNHGFFPPVLHFALSGRFKKKERKYLCIWIPSREGRAELWCGGRTGRGSGAGIRWQPAESRTGQIDDVGSGRARPNGSRKAIYYQRDARFGVGWVARKDPAGVMSSCCYSTSLER